MTFKIKNKEYPVIITKKKNKNTYIRVKEDGTIHVTTSYFATKKQIIELLEKHELDLLKMIDKIETKLEKEKKFYYLGKEYEVIYMPTKLEIVDNHIYVTDEKGLNKWFKQEMETIYLERINFWYHQFEESIPYPKLKIRKMKTRWGVCNRRDNSVTLNSELMRYEIDKLDYVIVHELSHFVHFNHSSDFWKLVSKYFPNYKKARKDLKE